MIVNTFDYEQAAFIPVLFGEPIKYCTKIQHEKLPNDLGCNDIHLCVHVSVISNCCTCVSGSCAQTVIVINSYHEFCCTVYDITVIMYSKGVHLVYLLYYCRKFLIINNMSATGPLYTNTLNFC